MMIAPEAAASRTSDSEMAPTARWIYVIPLADHLLLLTASAPKATFSKVQDELDRVLDGLAFRE